MTLELLSKAEMNNLREAVIQAMKPAYIPVLNSVSEKLTSSLPEAVELGTLRQRRVITKQPYK